MNHIYRSIWSQALNTWIAVSEHTKSKSKCSGTRNVLLATGLLFWSTSSLALPTGEQLVAGQASISTPVAGQMQINQTSQQAIVNWQGFSIAPNEAVNIQQPNAQSALLNRVVGQDASQIQGQLNANGQVYLVNPNGVIFGKTAQVDVGGLVASTHNIKDADFLNGVQHFTQDNAKGTVSNQGIIKTPEGGVVALIGNQVSNDGTINTPKGTTALAAGKTVDLDFKGDGLVEVKVSEAALNAQIANKGAIQADGGRVVLTAKAAGQLIDTVINQQGIIRAQGLVERNGEIILDGGNSGVTQINRSLNADGLQGGNISVTGKQIQINNGATVTASGDNGGGTIIIGGKQNTSQTSIQQTARISAQSKYQGNAGKIDVFANMDNGTINLAGQLDASAPKQGNGGFIDTSAAHVKIADTVKVSTNAVTGKTGSWLIDPTDFTIAASGGDMTGALLSAILLSSNVDISSVAGAGGINGDVNVNDAVSWSANLLTLIAERNININASLKATGTAELALHFGQATQFGSVSDDFFLNNGAIIRLPASANFSTIKGWGGSRIDYTIDTSQGYAILYSYGQIVDFNDGTDGFASDKLSVSENVAGLITDVTGDNSTIIDSFGEFGEFGDLSELSDADVYSELDEYIDSDELSDLNVFSDIDWINNSILSFEDTYSDGADRSQSSSIQAQVVPILQTKNSAGRVQRLQLSKNKKFLSLLLEDGSVRVWDFEHGVQRNIIEPNDKFNLTDISSVDDNNEYVSVASKTGIGVYDIIGTLLDKSSIKETDVKQLVISNDGNMLLMNIDDQYLTLWDNKQNKQLWRMPNKRGMVNNLVLSDDKHYAAVLSRQEGVYVYDLVAGKANPLTDAIDIIDLATGSITKSLPNFGEDVIYTRFKDNGDLRVGLASGKMLDWSMTSNSSKTTIQFPETISAIDQDKDSYAYIVKNGTVRIGNGLDDRHLSIRNPGNPITDAKLLDNKKLLTVLANGDLAVWDVATGKKILRLFSTKQGWTVMDAFGRFDGSDEAMENFNWIADEEAIPLDSFSENYYEPGLLASALQNHDYINSNPDRVKDGISLPPKVDLQLADQQAQDDKVAVQLNVYDRGGGINTIQIFHNGKLVHNEDLVIADQTMQDTNGNHRALTLNVTPSPGENTLKVIASNDMGIENSRSEISFDGKTKAYESSVRLMTVGINDYKERALHLNYSVPDAELIDDVLKKNSNLIASTKLINKQANKAQILAELKEISQGSQQDVLVIYFAGHGVAIGKEWYFLPYETRLQSSLEKTVATGITATELSDIFKKSKIQHIMLMVDSCYSGAGMEAFSTLENGQRYFSRQLSRSLGITVVTAAAKDQEATELKSLGHGLFTYLMTQELAKKDSTKPVTAHGIADSIMKSLPVFSKKLLGFSQEPVVYTKGNDFMLMDLLKDKK